ncbi:site-specific integrase [Phocaeicola sp.]
MRYENSHIPREKISQQKDYKHNNYQHFTTQRRKDKKAVSFRYLALFFITFVTRLLPIFAIFVMGNKKLIIMKTRNSSAHAAKNIKAKEPVKMRFKKLANGNLSIYLDIYHPNSGERQYEFLRIYLVPETDEKSKAMNSKNLELAKTIQAKKIVQLNTEIHGISNAKERSKILLRDYLASYASNMGKSVQQGINSLIYHLKKYKQNDIQIGKIDKNYILGFIDYLEDAQIEHTERHKGKTLSNNTQASYFKYFKMALNEAVTDDIISFNPILSIKKKRRPTPKKVDREFLTAEELQKFASTDFPNDLLKRAFMVGCLTGLRHCDIKQMKWSNVGVIENGVESIKLIQQKTQDAVSIPLNSNITKWLPKRGDAKDTDLVFEGLITLGRTNEILPTWAAKAGINKHLTFHISRHTFAVTAIENGIDIYVVSKILGHKSIAITEIYAKVLDKSKRDAMEKMNQIEV